MKIQIVPKWDAMPAGPADKLADVEIAFTEDDGVLAGFKLIGFSIWESASGARRVHMPSRTYTVNGDRRSFALLRPIVGVTADGLQAAILAEYDARAAGQVDR